ncbi:MAG: thioredoxin 1 [Thiomicrorhabdus sp.]|nr:MAG: thioredoxin 1 [Thiomicrorhabdus sp.]
MAVINLTMGQLKETIAQNEIVVFDFWAEWCKPCKQFGPIFESASEKYPNITFCKVNIEEQEELAGLFQVRSIPTIAFMRKEIVVFSNPGAIPAGAFEEG